VSGVFKFDYADRLIDIVSLFVPDMMLSGANTPYKEAVAKMILSLNMGSSVRAQRRETEWVAKAKEYIGANYHKKLRVEDIARALHIDRRYLRNLFVKETGESTKEYLDKLRMERAAELLAFSEQSIGIISRSVGYDDKLSFSKAFKKHLGSSPTDYRSREKSGSKH
jgi:YesN/AraC family two-component response regulator